MWLYLVFSLVTARASDAIPEAERERLFHRAVEAARNEGLDRRPEVQAEIDRLLYREFLKSKLSAHREGFEPSAAELRASYERSPLVRIRHLAVSSKVAGTAQRFDKIKRSKKASWGEVLDYRGENQLPAPLYQAAVKLGPGEYAQLSLSGAEHLIQLVDKKPFSSAFPPYLEYLRGKLRQNREHDFLVSTLKDLQEKP